MKILPIVLLACALPLFSKTGISGGFLLPVGDFARTDGGAPTIGGAQSGFGLGLQSIYPIIPSLGAGVESFLLFNASDHQTTADVLESGGVASASASGGNYFNVPVLGVLSYQIPIPNQPANIFLFGSAGIDFMKITEMDITSGAGQGTNSYKTGPAFAFSLGTKLKFSDCFFDFRFLSLGKHSIDVTASGPNGTSNFSEDQIVRMFAFSAGVDF